MPMDAKALTAAVKELNEANTAGKTDDVTRLLTKFKTDVEPTEELLRTSRAGIAVGKLRSHGTAAVSALAKEIVKAWKDAVEESKRKRKRGAEEASGDVKRTKAADSASASPAPGKASPRASSAKAEEQDPKSPKSPAPLSTIEKRDKPRTAKDDGVADKLRAEGDGGDSVRDKCVAMIYDALASDSNASTTVITERAVAIEREAFRLMKFNSGNDYRAKIRSLFLNLKDKGNPGLRNEINLGHVSAEKVASMTKEEMASESVRAMNAQIAENNLFKAKSAGETRAETDAFKCGRCGQRRTTYYQMQTRSADEPMTTFVNLLDNLDCFYHFLFSCIVCGNSWKFS